MKFGTRVNLGCSKREAQEAVYSWKEGVIDAWNSRIAFNAFALFRVLYSSSFYLGDFVLVSNIWSGILRTWAKFMGHPAGFFLFSWHSLGPISFHLSWVWGPRSSSFLSLRLVGDQAPWWLSQPWAFCSRLPCLVARPGLSLRLLGVLLLGLWACLCWPIPLKNVYQQYPNCVRLCVRKRERRRNVLQYIYN